MEKLYKMFGSLFGSNNRIPPLDLRASTIEKAFRELTPKLWKLDSSSPKPISVKADGPSRIIAIKDVKTLKFIEALASLDAEAVEKLQQELEKLLPREHVHCDTMFLFLWAFVRLRSFRMLFFGLLNKDEPQTTLALNLVFASASHLRWKANHASYLSMLSDCSKQLNQCTTKTDILQLMKIIWGGLNRPIESQEAVYADKELYTCQLFLEMFSQAHDLTLLTIPPEVQLRCGVLNLNFATIRFDFSLYLGQIKADATIETIQSLFIKAGENGLLHRQLLNNLA